MSAPPVSTPWSFWLLQLFLIVLFANLPLLVPKTSAFAPAQALALAALAVLLAERTLTLAPVRLAWPQSHLMLAFLGAAALSSLTALWPSHAVEQTLMLLKFVVIYLLLVNTVESWPRLRTTFGVLTVGGLFPALGAIHRYVIGDRVEGRASWIGIFDNPNDLAFALVVLFPIALALALWGGGALRLVAWAAVAAYATTIFLSYSRGGLVAFAVVLLLCFLRWCGPWARLPVLAIVGGAMAVVLGSFWTRSEGFADLAGDATLQQRMDTVRAGLAMFAAHPILGVGLGCSVIGWPLFAPAGAVTEGWLHSHNTFVQVLSETGLLGAGAYTLLIAAALVQTSRLARRWRRAREPQLHRAASALEIAIVGFLVCGLGGGYVLSWFPYILLGLVAAVSLLPRPGVEVAS